MTELLSQAEMGRNIQWLCDTATAPVRYLTHKHLLRTHPCSAQMTKRHPEETAVHLNAAADLYEKVLAELKTADTSEQALI